MDYKKARHFVSRSERLTRDERKAIRDSYKLIKAQAKLGLEEIDVVYDTEWVRVEKVAEALKLKNFNVYVANYDKLRISWDEDNNGKLDKENSVEQ